jgi:hypothetical protein
VRVLPAYLRNHSQGRRSRSASTPLASNLLARGLLLCIRTCLQKQAESATGRTLSLASADVLVQIRSDLRLRFAAFISGSPRHKRFSASARIEVCSYLATSKLSTSSPQCRLTSSVAFSLMAFDVLYARLYCPLGGSAPNHRAAAPPALRATFLYTNSVAA